MDVRKKKRRRTTLGDHRAATTVLESAIGYQLRHADRALENGLRGRLKAHGIPIGMWFYLRVLWIEDGLTQAALAKRVSAAAVTTALQLQRMEEHGLILRQTSGTDKRVVHVHLTERARALEGPLRAEAMSNNEIALRGLTAADIETAMHVLRTIRSNLEPPEED